MCTTTSKPTFYQAEELQQATHNLRQTSKYDYTGTNLSVPNLTHLPTAIQVRHYIKLVPIATYVFTVENWHTVWEETIGNTEISDPW